jgi:hypothetical protein
VLSRTAKQLLLLPLPLPLLLLLLLLPLLLLLLLQQEAIRRAAAVFSAQGTNIEATQWWSFQYHRS